MNTLFIEDNTNIIKAGLKRRSNLGNNLLKRASHSNQDIIKQTLDMFQNIKRKSKLNCNSGSTNDEEKPKNFSQSDGIQTNDDEDSDEEDYVNQDFLSLSQDEMNDHENKCDYHCIWDNSDLYLNGIFDLNDLNIFQLYKIRSLTYPDQKQVALSNQKLLISFQSVYEIMSEMRKRKRNKFNNGIISCYPQNSISKFDFNNEDWKTFLNDQLQIQQDIYQNNSFKQFEEYYSSYLASEQNKKRLIKFNRYEEAFLSSKNSQKIKENNKKRAAEILKRKFLMDEKEEENNEVENKFQSLIREEDYNNNIGSSELNNISISMFPHSVSSQQEKLPKKFQIKKVLSSKLLHSEASLNSPRNAKSSKENPPFHSQGTLSTFNSSTFNVSAFSIGTRRIRSIDFSNSQKLIQQLKQDNPENKDSNYQIQNQNNTSGIRSLNNIESTDNEDDQMNQSCSPQKQRLSRYQSQETLQSQDKLLQNREHFPLKSAQNTFLPAQSLRTNLDYSIQQKLLINTNRFEPNQQNSPNKINIMPSTESSKNSPMKNSSFNYFSFKNYQQPKQQIASSIFLPKINTNSSEIPQPRYSLKQQNRNTGHRIETQINDKKHLSSSKSIAKQVFLFDKQVLSSESPLKRQAQALN